MPCPEKVITTTSSLEHDPRAVRADSIADIVASASVSRTVSPPSVSVKREYKAVASRLEQDNHEMLGEAYRSMPMKIPLNCMSYMEV